MRGLRETRTARAASTRLRSRRRAPRWPSRLAPLLALTLVSGCDFSRIQELEEQAQVARSEIEVELQRRAELVPSLVETVQEYGSVPSDLVARLTEARVRLVDAVRSSDVEGMERTSAALSEALRRLLENASLDRRLLESSGFQVLNSQLEGTRQRIAAAGDDYNAAVQRFNEYITAFPQALTAKIIGAEKLKTFSTEDSPAEPSYTDR